MTTTMAAETGSPANGASAGMAEERQAFAVAAREFGAEKLAPRREEHDRFPFGALFSDVIAEAGEAGFYGINLPAEQGGVGLGTSMVAVVLEELCRHDASLGGIIFTNAAALEILRGAAQGQAAAPAHGADRSLGTVPLAFPSYASLREGELPELDRAGKSVSGALRNLALGGLAKWAVIPAREPEGGPVSYCLLDLASAGVQRSAPVVSLGLHGCPSIDLSLEEAPVRIVGARGRGPELFAAMQDRMAVCSAAMALGILKGSLQEALQYTADRFQGGRQIIDWPQVRMMLANMAIEVKTGESCLSAACAEMDAGVRGWERTAQAAAIHVAELAARATSDGVQLLGGNGYMKDFGQEKRFRDAKQVQALLGMALLRKMDYVARLIEAR